MSAKGWNKDELSYEPDSSDKAELSMMELQDEGAAAFQSIDIDLVSDRVTERIAAALREANCKQTDADVKVVEILRQLDQDFEDDLLSIDFKSLPNNFKILEEELSSFKFPMPRLWTTKYAPALLDEDERQVAYSLPDITLPVYSVDSVATPGHPKIVLTPRKEIWKVAFVRATKSLNDLNLDSQTPAQQNGGLGQTNSANKLMHPAKPDPLASTYLAGTISSHIGLADRPFSQFVKNSLKPKVIDSARSREMKAVEHTIDNLRLKVQLEMIDPVLPRIADRAISQSKNHVSVGNQTDDTSKSAFEAYVDLTRELSKGREASHKQVDKLIRYNFLKNLPIADYMSYREKWNSKTENLHFGPIHKTSLRSVYPLDKKSKLMKLPMSHIQQKKTSKSTLVKTPSHSYPDLHLVPPEEFTRMYNTITEIRKQSTSKPVHLQYPTSYCPMNQRQTYHVSEPGKKRSSNDMIRQKRSCETSNMRHVNCSKTTCRNSIPSLIPSVSKRKHPSNFEENDAAINFNHSLTLDNLIKGSTQIMRERNTALSKLQSSKEICNVVQHLEQQRRLEHSTSAPGILDPTLMRQYLSEVTFRGKSQTAIPNHKSRTHLGYKHSDDNQILKPLVLPRHVKERLEQQKRSVLSTLENQNFSKEWQTYQTAAAILGCRLAIM